MALTTLKEIMAIMSDNALRVLTHPTVRRAMVIGLTTLGTFLIEPNVMGQIKASQAQTETSDAALPSGPLQNVEPLIIAGGDLLEVQVFATPELSGRVRVDQFGNLKLPLGGNVPVAGLTAAQAGVAIEDRLRSNRIMRDPHVSVSVAEYTSQMVTVLGEVKKAGPVPLYGSQTLYDVLAAAGGPTATAGGSITISHRGDASPPLVVRIHSPNYSAIEHTTHISPGDTVVVSQADLVYVLGAVNRQGSVPMPNGVPLSVLNVLALSSGMTQIAAASKAAIIRQGPNGVVMTINVDLRRVTLRQDADVIMEASDILVVPVSNAKYIEQLILPSIATTAASSAITSVLLR
jgi:polysaccharide export outer membrane protein